MKLWHRVKNEMTFSSLFPVTILVLLTGLWSCAATYRQYEVDLNPQAALAEDFVSKGDYEQALTGYRKALRTYENEKNDKGVLFCLERMGWLQREIGQYGEALKLFQEAYPMGVRLHGDAAEIDADLGDVYMLSGYSEKAREHYEKTLETLEGFVFPTQYSRPPSGEQISTMIRKTKAIVHARDNLGTIHYFEGKYEEALKHLKIADELLNRVWTVTKHPLYGMFIKLDDDIYEGAGFCQTIMGATYSEMGEFNRAWPHFQAGKEAFEKGKRHYGLLLNKALWFKAEFLRADVKVDPQKFGEYDAFLENAESFGALDIVWRMCFIIGEALAKEKKYPEARKYLARAIDALELTRSRLREDTLKKIFAASVQEVYAEMIRLLFEMKQYEAGFNYLERAKARAFLDMLAGRSVKAKKSVDARLIEKEKQIQGQVDVLARRLRNLKGPDRKEFFDLYRKLLAERKNVLETIKGQSLEFAATTTVTIVDSKKIAARLGHKAALVSYFLDRERTLVWVLKQGIVSAFALEAGKQTLKKLVTEYREAIESQQELLIGDLGSAISGHLIRPILDKISGAGTLFIIPSGALHYVPFSSLPISKDRFLVQDYSITVLPNASSLFFLDKKVTQDKESVFAMGNPERGSPDLALEFAEQEVKSISKDFARRTLLTGKDATESTIKGQNLVDTGIVHIAAHGRYNAGQPLKSALLLAADQQNDGNLETFEIFSLNMNPRLVILSACQSGVGKLEGGDEVQSLNRAFMYAGAGGVIASLWKVADQSTFTLMEYFYDALRTRPAAEALRDAQVKLMGAYPSPYHWAAFYLTGGLEN
ncbi:MAG: CHAT domain-containing tetratricopeptide repeat protein [Pseudomonadota bacterium]